MFQLLDSHGWMGISTVDGQDGEGEGKKQGDETLGYEMQRPNGHWRCHVITDAALVFYVNTRTWTRLIVSTSKACVSVQKFCPKLSC